MKTSEIGTNAGIIGEHIVMVMLTILFIVFCTAVVVENSPSSDEHPL